MWVAPFGDLRIDGYVPLPEAYRSLSRPSSAVSAKASALRPYRLTFLYVPLFDVASSRGTGSLLFISFSIASS